MNKTGVFSMLMKFLGKVFLVDLILIGLVVLIGWWAGWQTEDKFKSAIQIAGILVIGIGFLGIIGNRDSTRSSENQYNMSATQRSSWDRTQQNLVAFVAGGVCLVIGWL